MHGPDTRHVVLLRHGRTAYNREGRLQGQLDVPLDQVGRRQAAAVAPALHAAGITAVVSSDLRRARATAEVVGHALGLPVRRDTRLREQHYGSWQGLTHDQVRERWPREHDLWAAGQGDPVGGEALADVEGRAHAAMLESLPASGTLLVVTHGDTARALLGRMPAPTGAGAGTAQLRLDAPPGP